MPTDIVLAAMSAARDTRFARGEPVQDRYQDDGLGPEALWEFDEDMNVRNIITLLNCMPDRPP